MVHRCLLLLLRMQEIEEQGDDGAGGKKGRDHTENDGEAQMAEQLAGHAGEQRQRQKHDAGGGGGSCDTAQDIFRALQRSFIEAKLPHILLAEAAVQDHDGVVHDHTYAKNQGADRDEVHGKAHGAHTAEGHHDRHRDGGTDDQGSLQIPEKDEQDHHGQHDSQGQRLEHALQAVLDIVRGVADNLHAEGRVLLLQGVEGLMDCPGHVHRGSALLLGDRDRDDILAIVAGYALPVFQLIVDRRHVGQMDHLSAPERQRDGLDRLNALVACAGTDVQRLVAVVDAAGGDGKIRRSDELGQCIHCQSVLFHLRPVQLNADVGLPSAVHRGLRH